MTRTDVKKIRAGTKRKRVKAFRAVQAARTNWEQAAELAMETEKAGGDTRKALLLLDLRATELEAEEKTLTVTLYHDMLAHGEEGEALTPYEVETSAKGALRAVKKKKVAVKPRAKKKKKRRKKKT